MPSKKSNDSLSVWNLGELGVNVVDSPLHLVDGELTISQNAEPFDSEGEAGIRKRLGIGLFSSDNLGSAVLGITAVPLPDPFPPIGPGIAYLGGGTAPAARYSDDAATTWTDTTSPDPDASAVRMTEGRGFVSSAGVLYYVQNTPVEPNGTVVSWRGPGHASSTLGSVPASLTIGLQGYALIDAGNVPFGGVCGDIDTDTLFLLVEYQTHDNTPTAWVLYKWQIGVDSAFAQLGEGFFTEAGPVAGYIADARLNLYGHPVFWQGRVWVAVNSNSGSNPRIYSIAAGETTWTLDTTLAGTTAIGTLYTDAAANFLWFTRQASPETLGRRTTAGVYSTPYTSAAGKLTPAYAVDDTLYLIEDRNPTVGWRVKLSTNGGGTWSTIYTDATRVLEPANFRAAVVFAGNVYLINMYGETTRVTGTTGIVDTWASDGLGTGAFSF